MFYLILLIAIIIRFLYFPDNIYFGYDQARDAFVALEILKGDLKLIGPTTAFEGLHHGVLYYYILAPLYWLGNMSPEFTAAAWRIFNAVGVFLIFYIAKILFDKKTGLVAALLFAVSFEQTQFAIFLHHPSLVVLSMMVFYLGLAEVIFAKKSYGLILAALGFGSSIQFEFPLLYLVVPFLLVVAIFYKYFVKIPKKIVLIACFSFILSVSTFVLAEIKYNFTTLNGLLGLLKFNPQKSLETIASTYIYTVNKMISLNFTGNLIPSWWLAVIFLVILVVLLKNNEHRPKFVFLSIWFFSLILTFVVNGGVEDVQRNIPLFYPNVGVSVSLVIFASFLLIKLYKKIKIMAVILMIVVTVANLQLIQYKNPNGTIEDLTVQQGMLLGDEKKVLDYMYHESSGQPFSVKAVTMPFFINTTWSYLFEWHGKKYGYLPVWNGKNALGYPGNLVVDEKQETAPKKRFLILEPTRGIAPYLIDDYLKEENYFTKVVDEKSIGAFIIQKRGKL